MVVSTAAPHRRSIPPRQFRNLIRGEAAPGCPAVTFVRRSADLRPAVLHAEGRRGGELDAVRVPVAGEILRPTLRAEVDRDLPRVLFGRRQQCSRRPWRRLARAPEAAARRSGARPSWECRAAQSRQRRRGQAREPSCGAAMESAWPCCASCLPGAFETMAGSSNEAGSPWPPPPLTFASWKPPSLVSVSVMMRLPPGWNGSVYVPSKTEGPRFFSCAFATPARNSDASSADAARGPLPIRAAADAALISTARRASSPSDGRRRADNVVSMTGSIATAMCEDFCATSARLRHHGSTSILM